MKRRRKRAAPNPAQLTLFPAFELRVVGPQTWQVVAGKPSAELRVRAAARAIGVSARTVYYWIDTGVIKAHEYRRPGSGRLIWITAAAVERLRDQKTV
jgi:excisionase family DNA binding protein